MSDILDPDRGLQARGDREPPSAPHPLAEIEARRQRPAPPRGFVNAITHKLAAGDYALIAEIKKARPPRD